MISFFWAFISGTDYGIKKRPPPVPRFSRKQSERRKEEEEEEIVEGNLHLGVEWFGKK